MDANNLDKDASVARNLFRNKAAGRLIDEVKFAAAVRVLARAAVAGMPYEHARAGDLIRDAEHIISAAEPPLSLAAH